MTTTATPPIAKVGPGAGEVMPGPPAWIAWGARLVRHLPRARYRAMNWLCRRPVPPFVAELPGSPLGLRFECDLRNVLAREVFFTGRYEPQETALIRQVLEPGQTFVDVGAHWGYFSLVAAERVGPSGRIVAIEADPRNYWTLRRTIALNPLGQATVIHAAVAAEPGILTLAGFDEAADNWGTSRLAPGGGAPGAATFAVEARPLDLLLDELGVGPVDLVKIDIEGAEALALRGMRAGLLGHRYRRILLELHPVQLRELGTDARAVSGSLQDAGYQGWSIDHSFAAHRRASYARHLRVDQILEPLRAGAEPGAWPHQFWIAPGVAPPAPLTCPSRAEGG